MKKIYPLTDTQRNYAGNHVGLVYKFLYLNHLDIDEYYDIVIFGYLLAVQLYDEDERLKNRYLFSTIAWKQMRYSLFEHYRNNSRKKRNAPVISMNSNGNHEESSLDCLLPDRRQSIHESATDKIYALELMTYMAEKEQEVVKLKAYGYTYREIETQCGLSIEAVGSRFARMRRRLKQIEAV